MSEAACDLFRNPYDETCAGPRFDDPQPEGIDLRVCAFHLLLSRNEWITRADRAEAEVKALRAEVDRATKREARLEASVDRERADLRKAEAERDALREALQDTIAIIENLSPLEDDPALDRARALLRSSPASEGERG